MQDCQREHRLGAGGRGNPFVALRRRHVKSRADVNRATDCERAVAILRRAKFRILTRELDRRAPGFEEVRSKGKQHFGLIDSICGKIAPSEHQLCGLARGLIAKRLVIDGEVRLPCAEERRADFLQRRARRRPDHRDPIVAGGGRLLQMIDEQLQCIVPGNFVELAIRAAQHRRAQAVGIVESLQTRLPARTDGALADGIAGIALQLDDASFANLRDEAASGRAFTASGGVKRRHAGDDVLIGHDVGDQLACRRLASGDRGGRPGRCRQFYERAPGESFRHDRS